MLFENADGESAREVGHLRQDRSFTCLNRLRSVVRPFPSLIEFSTVLLLTIHQPAYRNGTQDHKENVTRGTNNRELEGTRKPRRGFEQRQEPRASGLQRAFRKSYAQLLSSFRWECDRERKLSN